MNKAMNLSILLACLLVATSQLTLSTAKGISCPEGTTPKLKPGMTVTSNGCGGATYQVKIGEAVNPFSSSFTSCCNDHDFCFKTCHTNGEAVKAFNACNDAFESCLKSKCKGKSLLEKAACKTYAAAYYTGV